MHLLFATVVPRTCAGALHLGTSTISKLIYWRYIGTHWGHDINGESNGKRNGNCYSGFRVVGSGEVHGLGLLSFTVTDSRAPLQGAKEDM